MDVKRGQGVKRSPVCVFVGKVLACNQIQHRQSGGAGARRELTFHTVKAKGGLVLLGLMQLHIKLCLSEKTLGLS